MYGTKAAFDYITVGGRCIYETNKIFEFPAQPFSENSSLYTTEHDDILCTFMDTSSYVGVLFSEVIDADKFYMLRLVYYAKNINNLKLKVTWKKNGESSFCPNCYENIILDISNDTFIYTDIDLRSNSDWVGEITNLRLSVYNSEVVPLFIKYFSVYSPTTYTCSRSSCPYYSNYQHPCVAGKDLHVLSGKLLDNNSINLASVSSFLFNIYDTDFVINFESNYYFLDGILSELNSFFNSMPIPCLKALKDEGKIKISCTYVKPLITHTELSEKLGFFNTAGTSTYTYSVENYGDSDYIDVAGNLYGIHKFSGIESLNFNKVFSVGFSDIGDFYPESFYDFLNETVLFHTLSVTFDGYLNCFELYCRVLSGGGKILIYRRSGDKYTVVNSYSLNETNSMAKHAIDWPCKICKGDIIGIFNLKLSVSKKSDKAVNYYSVTSGYSDNINKSTINDTAFASVSIYAYLKLPVISDIPIVVTYNEAAYVDKLSFELEYSSSYTRDFNIIFGNTFNYTVNGCQLNVKDSLDVITEVPAEVIDITCLSDNNFFAGETEAEISSKSVTPPVDLLGLPFKDVLRYSWESSILEMYINNNYTYTYTPGDIFFYYHFPAILDLYKVVLYNIEDQLSDNCLLRVLDKTKVSPSFSNTNDIVTVDSKISDWEFNVPDGIFTEGVGVFVYNYEDLPNISFSEIELYTKVGSIPEYIIDVVGVTHDAYTIPFDSDIDGASTNIFIGEHIKSLTININFITNNTFFDFKNFNIYSSFLPDDYFVSSDKKGEGIITVYNTRSKALNCYLLDYTLNNPSNLVYEFDFDDDLLHKGSEPVKYVHSPFYFISNDYKNNEYNTYALSNLLNSKSFFVTKLYQFEAENQEEWYSPYDYSIPGYDGEFMYTDSHLKLRPLVSESPRWFNYINTNEFYNDLDITLRFNYVGNMDDFVFIGITCCDREYTNHLKFYSAFQTSPEYGLEFKLDGDTEATYYRFDAPLSREAGLKIVKRGDVWTFYYFYGDSYYELTTFTLFDTEILVAISTMFNAPYIKDNIIASFRSCEIKASKVISGKKIWYTINDGLNYVHSGSILDNSRVLDNLDKTLTFSCDYTVDKFVYTFNTLRAKYLKFVNTQTKNILVTELRCCLNGVTIPIKQGYVSYSNDLFFGKLDGETPYLNDNVIINYDLGHSICEGDDDTTLSAVGVEFDENATIDSVIFYYISEVGTYEPCRLMYSYDNVTYYDVYDNFFIFQKGVATKIQCFFNEFVGYRGKNEIVYDLSSNEQYSTDFSTEGVLDFKWSISSPYTVDSGGVWLERGTGPNNIYSQFAIDGDFILDIYFDEFSGYSGGNSCRVYVETVFQNNTSHSSYYVAQDFVDDKVKTRKTTFNIEENRISGGIRIKRTGSTFFGYYRKYGTTWDEISNTDYGYDYIYPVKINIYLSGENFNLRIKKVLITQGIGIANTDFMALESSSLSTLFVRGRHFSSNDTYALLCNEDISQLCYPINFSLLHSVSSLIPAGGYLVEKPHSFGLTYENTDLSLHWFNEYLDKYKLPEVLVYNSTINSVATVSIGNNNINKNLFIDIADPSVKAVYKSRYGINTLISEEFGETISSGIRLEGDYSHINNNYIELTGGVIHTNIDIYGSSAVAFETSVTFDPFTGTYTFMFCVGNAPTATDIYDSTSPSIRIANYGGYMCLYVDGTVYNHITNGTNKLFSIQFGVPYLIGIKFIPGAGTVIYWQGATDGYLVFDYTLKGFLYSWVGNQYGTGNDSNNVSTLVHVFRCFEDKKTYKELTNIWMQRIGVDDYFILSDGRSPNPNRWVVTGDPRVYNNSLKIVSNCSDKIQSKAFLCGAFEVVLDYSALCFILEEGYGLVLNLECYDIYKDYLIGQSKFTAGYNAGVGTWVSGLLGDSAVYYTADVSNRKLKIKSDGYNIQYFLSDGGGGWIEVFSTSGNNQYYYKVSVEGTALGVTVYLNSVTFGSEGNIAPTDIVSLVPTSWKFSSTDKAYQAVSYVPLGELLQERHSTFSIDCIFKADDSLFLSYIECNKDSIVFSGAIVVGDTHANLVDALTVAEDGVVIYLLPGTYQLGGYTINKKVFIVGIGDYKDINIGISGSSVKLDGAEVIFRNISINEQLLYNNTAFRVQGDKISYFTLDNCKYTSSCLNTEPFITEGSKEFYVYLRRSYINHDGHFISYGASTTIYFDILNCKLVRTLINMFYSNNHYQIRGALYSNSSLYEPEVINTVPVVVLFSPSNEINIYLNTPKGMEKKIVFSEAFEYISFGNCSGGFFFYGGAGVPYFSEFLVPTVDESFKLFIQGYVDTLRVFDTYLSRSKFLENINIVKNTSIDLKLAYNNTIVDYKVYTPLNMYNSELKLGRGTPSVIDEFIWSQYIVKDSEILSYYSNLLEKIGYSACNISNSIPATYKFFIDTGVTAGIGSLLQAVPHNFDNLVYYSDDINDPALVSNVSTQGDARWCSLSNSIAQGGSSLTTGIFSIFPKVDGCDFSRWEYTGESGYIDIIPTAVLGTNYGLNDVYNIRWERNKINFNDYFISNFSAPLKINIKTFGEKTCDCIVIESGYKIGAEYVGYITKCDVVIDATTVFSVVDNVNSTIRTNLESIPFTNIEIIIYETKQVPGFSFNNSFINSDVTAFIKYIKILSKESSSSFNTTMCNAYEFYTPIKVKELNTSKVGTCALEHYYSNSYMNGCVSLSSLDLDNLPSAPFTSILVKTDNLYACSFGINEYLVDIVSKDVSGSIDSWKVYLGDAILYEEFFYIKGISTSIGVSFYKPTIFEVGTYYENFGSNAEWSITDELVLRIYSSEVVDTFYMCIGDKETGRYYKWIFNLVSGWNELKFNFYSSNVIRYIANLVNKTLLFKDIAIFNIWFGGVCNRGFIVLDDIHTDKSSVKNILASKKDAFYIPVFFESTSGSVQLDFTTYWGSNGIIFDNILSDKTILTVFSDNVSFSLVNKLSGSFVLGVYSYLHNVRSVKTFGKANAFDVNSKVNVRLDWYCTRGYFSVELFINGGMCGRIHFNLIETEKLKVTGILVGGTPVYVTSIYNSLSLCGQPNHIKIYSSITSSEVSNDNLFIKTAGEYKNLVENSPMCVGEIQAGDSVKLPVIYTGKSKKLNELNLRVKWVGNY